MKFKLLFLLSLCLLLALCSCETEASEPVETTVTTETTTIIEETESTEEIPTERVYYDNTDFPFVFDEAPLGYWEVCGAVEKIEDYPDNILDSGYMAMMVIETGMCSYISERYSQVLEWTDGMILDKQSKLNSKYVVKEIDGEEYMFIEWKQSYYIYTGEFTYAVMKKMDAPAKTINPFDDIRAISHGEFLYINESEYVLDDIKTYSYSDNSIFENNQEYAMDILEKGKDPGLGIRELHERGITGKGVNVAIIDQNLITEKYHPEYDGKIVEYRSFGLDLPSDYGSMHGPAVASLLVGETVGVAPGAKLYYASAISSDGDSQYYADAIYWIIEENEKLPADEKIRVISVSAAPSGEGSPFKKNLESYTEAVDAAFDAGILVIDCRVGFDSGFVSPGYGDIDNRDNFTKYNTGFPDNPSDYANEYEIYVPTSLRTSAGQYYTDDTHYVYWGKGGLSWGVPYAAGVLALGWQLNPDIDFVQMHSILYHTSYINENGAHIINPTAFIEYIEERLDN
jgi:Subtilisin-like serine proteases